MSSAGSGRDRPVRYVNGEYTDEEELECDCITCTMPERPPMPDIHSSVFLDWRFSLVLSAIGIAYISCLDVLSTVGFTQPGSTSISAYIETPGATGAMAVATAPSLISMREMERYLAQRMLYLRIGQRDDSALSLAMTMTLRTLTFWLFLVCYGGFLICNVSKYEFEHYVFVGLFAVAFLVHAVLRLVDTKAWNASVPTASQSNTLAAVIVSLGFLFFLTMVLIQMGLHTDDPPAWLEGFKDAGGFYYTEVRPCVRVGASCASGLCARRVSTGLRAHVGLCRCWGSRCCCRSRRRISTRCRTKRRRRSRNGCSEAQSADGR